MIQFRPLLTPERLQKVAHILKTISHPVRLEILKVLEQQESLDVTTLRERLAIEVEQSMLSHHLIKMRDNGILDSEKRGKSVFYTVAERQVLQIFDCMEKCNF
jgi:ArsR family transcriptional regulator